MKAAPGKAFTIPLLFQHNKDGTVFPVELRARGYSSKGRRLLQISARDITERKRSEEALCESEEQFRELFDAAADLISVIDLQAKFIALNKKFEEESGWSKAEMLNQSVLTSGIVTPESSVKIAEYVSELIAGREIPIFEVTGVTKSGKEIPYELRAVPIRRNGEVVAINADKGTVELERAKDGKKIVRPVGKVTAAQHSSVLVAQARLLT
jgi:PAS domain S-box-containing protein